MLSLATEPWMDGWSGLPGPPVDLNPFADLALPGSTTRRPVRICSVRSCLVGEQGLRIPLIAVVVSGLGCQRCRVAFARCVWSRLLQGFREAWSDKGGLARGRALAAWIAALRAVRNRLPERLRASAL